MPSRNCNKKHEKTTTLDGLQQKSSENRVNNPIEINQLIGILHPRFRKNIHKLYRAIGYQKEQVITITLGASRQISTAVSNLDERSPLAERSLYHKYKSETKYAKTCSNRTFTMYREPIDLKSRRLRCIIFANSIILMESRTAKAPIANS